MNRFLFDQPNPFERLKQTQVALSLMVFLLLLLGPYDDFYVEMAPWLYSPQMPFAWFPRLDAHFWTLKYSVMVLALLSTMKLRIAQILFAICFLLFNFYIKSFGTTWWITNTHLNFFAIALCLTPRNSKKKSSQEFASFLIAFMTLYIAILYFQAGLSKLIHGGLGWFLDGERIRTETILLGTSFGKWLTQWPRLFNGAAFGTGLFELLLPPFFLLRNTQRFAALIAIGFHLSTFLVMGISFWFLWFLYPTLFFNQIMNSAKIPSAIKIKP
jgi:hypothetical protein